MSAELHVAVADRLRGDGQRYTSQRRTLVDVLESADRPLTIPEIVRSHPDLPQSSVYRNLAILERAGAVHRVVTADEFARFELAEDLAGHHHHLICSTCGAVADVTIPQPVERAISDTLRTVAGAHAFLPETHRLDLIGVCPDCT